MGAAALGATRYDDIIRDWAASSEPTRCNFERNRYRMPLADECGSSLTGSAHGLGSGETDRAGAADLLNLRRVRELDAPVLSIGGAGTFDGIVVIGRLAVLLAAI